MGGDDIYRGQVREMIRNTSELYQTFPVLVVVDRGLMCSETFFHHSIPTFWKAA